MSDFRRQHPVAAVTQLFIVLRQNIVPIIIFVVVGSRNSGDYFWMFLLFGLISTFVLGVASWYRFTFRVIDGELQINKGLFVRKKLYLSKERIQVIDITEGIIQRMFGLVKVEIKSAGGGTEKATISAILYEEAIEMRKMLREETKEIVAQEKESEEEIEQVEVNKANNPVWKLSARDLFYAALTSGNFGLIASILGAVSGQLDQFITKENLDFITAILPGYSQLSTILWAVFFVIFISYIISFVGVIFRYTDFKIEKKEKELLITSGLFERKHITVPFDRIQALRFVEGVLRQPFGYGMLYVESAGFEQNENDRSIVLLPFVRKEKLEAFLKEFLDEEIEFSSAITPPKRALFRYIRKANYGVIIATPIIWIFWSYAWLLFFLILPLSLYGFIQFRDALVKFGEHELLLQYRVLAKSTAIVKRNRAQVAEYSANPFQKRKRLATLHVVAASGAGGKTFSVEDIDNDDAFKVLNWPIQYAGE